MYQKWGDNVTKACPSIQWSMGYPSKPGYDRFFRIKLKSLRMLNKNLVTLLTSWDIYNNDSSCGARISLLTFAQSFNCS